MFRAFLVEALFADAWNGLGGFRDNSASSAKAVVAGDPNSGSVDRWGIFFGRFGRNLVTVLLHRRGFAGR
jgi:hypothetical protein